MRYSKLRQTQQKGGFMENHYIINNNEAEIARLQNYNLNMQTANFNQMLACINTMQEEVVHNQKEISDKNKEIQELKQKNQFLKEGIYGTDVQLLEDFNNKSIKLFKKNKYYFFLEAVINTVKIFEIDLGIDKKLIYIVTFENKTCNKIEICFLEMDLQSPKIFFNKMEKAGLYVMTEFSDAEKLKLLRRLIYSKADGSKAFIPYKAGWYEGKYMYGKIEGTEIISQLGISTPYLKRYFSRQFIKIKDIADYIIKTLSRFENVLIFTVMTGSVAYTPLKKAGFRPSVLFTLDSSLQETLCTVKCLQLWEKEMYISISEPKFFLEELSGYKDETAIIIDNGSSYSLKVCQDLDMVLQNGQILKKGVFEEFNAVPIVSTSRYSVWKERCKKVLMLPNYVYGIPKMGTCAIWKNLCDMLSRSYEIWTKKIGKIKYTEVKIKKYITEFEWLIEAYNILCWYLDTKGLLKKYNIISVNEFEEYVHNWLFSVEQAEDMDISEIFIMELKKVKEAGLIKFVKPCNFQISKEGNIIIIADEDYLYIAPDVIEEFVKKYLPGINVKNVYHALVEDGYAKGEKDKHIYPKVPQKAGFETRFRMACLKRDILLTDAELLLEVL